MERQTFIILGGEGVIANNTPDDEALVACRNLGTELAKFGKD